MAHPVDNINLSEFAYKVYFLHYSFDMTSSIRGNKQNGCFLWKRWCRIDKYLECPTSTTSVGVLLTVLCCFWVIKQLFHGYLGNSHPQSLSRGEDLGNCCPNLSQIFSTNSRQWFDCFPRNHEITVYYQQIVQSDYTCSIKALIRCSCLRHFIQYLIISKKYGAVLRLDQDDFHN